MIENPFINYWLWYYDVLWRYWPIVVLLTIIVVWMIHRRFAKRQREWDERMEKSRKETEDFKMKLYKSSFGRVNISQIHEGKFLYDGMNFSIEINNGKLIYTDKETGNKIVKELCTENKSTRMSDGRREPRKSES